MTFPQYIGSNVAGVKCSQHQSGSFRATSPIRDVFRMLYWELDGYGQLQTK